MEKMAIIFQDNDGIKYTVPVPEHHIFNLLNSELDRVSYRYENDEFIWRADGMIQLCNGRKQKKKKVELEQAAQSERLGQVKPLTATTQEKDGLPNWLRHWQEQSE